VPPRRSSGSGTRLRSAEALLAQLNERLDAPLTWELKRELVETLVEASAWTRSAKAAERSCR
jgi:hypothetical protein